MNYGATSESFRWIPSFRREGGEEGEGGLVSGFGKNPPSNVPPVAIIFSFISPSICHRTSAPYRYRYRYQNMVGNVVAFVDEADPADKLLGGTELRTVGTV